MKNFLIVMLLVFSVSLFAQTDQNIRSLKITQKKCLKNKGTKLILKEVLSDSRCPEGVQCIWAGEAKVVVSVYEGKKFVKDEELVISGKNEQINKDWFMSYLPFSQKNIKSINIVPYPKEGVKINPKEYYIKIGYIK
ncbi:hypothetical protein [Flavobacterium frigoris]|uniref:Uncharacterized protein n=1 Tax=Flavobacterium frigoris TaxID=229204 RepID=A0A1H9C4W9_FLAFI|nr:hypothetical protein [Flavobacterium frigoris]SEP96280.1 hypothetical protein SAMN05444355_10177 [Flavobacterium frigoris]